MEVKILMRLLLEMKHKKIVLRDAFDGTKYEICTHGHDKDQVTEYKDDKHAVIWFHHDPIKKANTSR